ncbi:uncharacterized protein LOC144430455 [Styela clava]
MTNFSCDTLEIEEISTISNPSNLSIFHMNIRSIQRNFDYLINLLSEFQHPPHIIGISETKLKHNPLAKINIPGYNFIHQPSDTNAGGVGCYIRSNLKFKIIHDIKLNHPDCEDLWIELNNSDNHKTVKTLIICILYKHPRNDIPTFTSALSAVLERISNKQFILLGDFNINLLKHSLNKSISEYMDMISSYCTVQIITKPTRVSSSSCTLIDHVYTNIIHKKIHAYVISCSITDHFPVLCSISDISLNSRNEPRYKRDMKQFRIDNFREDADSIFTSWSSTIVPNRENFDALCDDFIFKIKNLIDKHAPMKMLSRKDLKIKKKPWLSKGIRVSIKNKNKMRNKYYLKGNMSQQHLYKRYCNKLKGIINKAKQLYYHNTLKQNRNNIKQTWRTIKEIVNVKNDKQNTITEIMLQNKIISSDKLLIANEFNSYFTNIGPKLASEFNDVSDYKKYLHLKISQTIFLQPVSLSEIICGILSLKKGKAVGPDNIPSCFLQHIVDIISPALMILFNASIQLDSEARAVAQQPEQFSSSLTNDCPP